MAEFFTLCLPLSNTVEYKEWCWQIKPQYDKHCLRGLTIYDTLNAGTAWPLALGFSKGLYHDCTQPNAEIPDLVICPNAGGQLCGLLFATKQLFKNLDLLMLPSWMLSLQNQLYHQNT